MWQRAGATARPLMISWVCLTVDVNSSFILHYTSGFDAGITPNVADWTVADHRAKFDVVFFPTLVT